MIRQKHLRSKYLEAKTVYARNKTTDNKMRLINATKSYKKSILKYFSQYILKSESKMRRLLSDDLKAFLYKIFNKKQNNLDNKVNVPLIDRYIVQLFQRLK